VLDGPFSSSNQPKRWLYEPVSAVELEDEEFGRKGQMGASFGASFTTTNRIEAEENYGLEVVDSSAMERKMAKQAKQEMKKSPIRNSSVLAPPSNSPSAQLARILTSSSPNPAITPSRKSKAKTQTSSPDPRSTSAASNQVDDPLLIVEPNKSDEDDERTF
jgi:hypothetical protein